MNPTGSEPPRPFTRSGASTVSIALLALGIGLRTVPAVADENARATRKASRPPASEKRTPPDPVHADAEQRRQAQAHFEQGKKQFDDDEFDAALEHFTLSQSIVTSPNTELYRARCLIELGRLAEAYRSLDAVVSAASALGKRDDRYVKTADAARLERAALGKRLAFVQITAKHATLGTRLFINGREVPRDAWNEPTVVTPGAVEISLRSPGGVRHQKRVTVPVGTTRQVALDLGAQKH